MKHFINGGSLVFILALFTLVSCNNKEQAATTYAIALQIENAPGAAPQLYSFYGNEKELMDTLAFDGTYYYYDVKENLRVGMYRAQYSDSMFVDFIYNKQPVTLKVLYPELGKGTTVLQSEENEILFDYQHKLQWANEALGELYKKRDSIMEVNMGNPSDELMKGLQEEARAVYTELDRYSRELAEEHKGTLAAAVVNTMQPPTYAAYREKSDKDPSMQQYESEAEFLIDHFFDKMDFNDPRLLYTPYLDMVCQGYLNYFMYRFPEEMWKEPIDSMMNKAKVNQQVYNYLADKLVKSFSSTDFEETFRYIAETYFLTDFCEAEPALRARVEDKVGAIKSLKQGNPAPPITAPDINGKEISLASVKAPVTLIFFWASDCSHCAESMPEMVELYNTYHPKGLAIYGYSVDTDEAAWKNAVKEKQLPWVNVSHVEGSKGAIGTAYNVWRTPYFVLVDQDKKIISRPINIDQLKDYLNTLLK